jgi:hypothetical protein
MRMLHCLLLCFLEDPQVSSSHATPCTTSFGLVLHSATSYECIAPAAAAAAGVPAPLPGPPRGTFEMTVDEAGQKASWKLQLCDVPHDIASHLHSVSESADTIVRYLYTLLIGLRL